jgi:hypothetical protein
MATEAGDGIVATYLTERSQTLQGVLDRIKKKFPQVL